MTRTTIYASAILAGMMHAVERVTHDDGRIEWHQTERIPEDAEEDPVTMREIVRVVHKSRRDALAAVGGLVAAHMPWMSEWGQR